MQEQSVNSIHEDQSVYTRPEEKSRASTLIEYGKTILVTVLAALLLKTFVLDAYRIPSASMEHTLQIGDFLLVNKLAYGLRTPRHLPLVAGTIPSFAISFFQKIHRGDVIVFELPGKNDIIANPESTHYIKRCVGLPGDTLEIYAGLVYVNKIFAPFPPYGIQPDYPNVNLPQRNPVIFPEGSAFSNTDYGPIVIPKKDDILKLEPATLSQWRRLIEHEGHTVQTADKILIDGAAASEYHVQKNYYFVLGDNRDNSMDSRYWGFVADDQVIGEALLIYWSWDTEVSASCTSSDKPSSIRWNRIGTLIK